MATILIVDDDPALREMLTLVLELEGYQVRTAAHGDAGLVQLQHAVDLILCDVHMAGLDGVAFYQRLRADPAYHALPLIFLSAVPARLAGTDLHLAVLPKPFDLDTLLTTIARMIATSS